MRLSEPTLGAIVKARRLREGLTQEGLASIVGCTGSYITKIENGGRTRLEKKLQEQLAIALNLSAADIQHIADLVRPDEQTPTEADYQHALTEQMVASLAHLHPHMAAYLDERWSILTHSHGGSATACNEAYSRAYPGLEQQQNVLSWFFREPLSRFVMMEWEPEALLTVQWFRGLMGRYGNPEWAKQLLDDLSDEPEFVAMWEQCGVTFGRHQPMMHLRDPETGEPYSVHVQITLMPHRPDPVQFFLGVREPYCGPAELLELAQPGVGSSQA